MLKLNEFLIFRLKQIIDKNNFKKLSQTQSSIQRPISPVSSLTTTKKTFDLTVSDENRIESDQIDINVNVIKLKNEGYLKKFTENLQLKLKNLQPILKKLEERLGICDYISKNYDVETLLLERDEIKSKYLSVLRKNNKSRILLESQKRLISSPNFLISTKSKSVSNLRIISSAKTNKKIN